MEFKIRRSIHQEKTIARQVGGRRVAGSGNQPSNKGDVRADGWLIEAKQTSLPRYNLTLAVFRKIEREAIRAKKEAALIVEMAGRTLVVLDYQTWLSIRP